MADLKWALLLEPHFMRPEVSMAIPGAERTVIVPALVQDDGLKVLTKADYDRIGVDQKVIGKQARENASALLKTLEPKFERNAKNVIEYAELAADSQLVVSTLFAPDFAARFESTLGPELLVVAPSRSRIFVFPKLASSVKEFGPMILDIYRDATYPVSTEVFEVTPEGLKAIGNFERP